MIARFLTLAVLGGAAVVHADDAATGDRPDVAIDFWYGSSQTFGLPGHAQRWINVLGNVSGAESIDAVTYSLDGGPDKPLSFAASPHRIRATGDFNIDLNRHDLAAGRHEVIVTALAGGQPVASKSMTFDLVNSGKPWPLPYTIDWSEVDRIQDAVQVVDGDWKLTAGGLRTINRHYDRMVAFGDDSWRDYEVSTTVTVHAVTGPRQPPNITGVTHAAISPRWPGHDFDKTQPHTKWHPLGATGEFRLEGLDLKNCRWRIFDGQRKQFVNSKRRRQLELDTPYAMKHRVVTQPDGVSRYSVKLWPAGQPEPAGWDLERLEPNDNVPVGSACLIAHFSDVTFGDVHVVPVP